MTQFLTDSIRFLPIILFLVYLLFSTWVIKKHPLGGHRSVSDHIGHSGKLFRVSVITFLLIAAGMCFNLVFWIAPNYSATNAYYTLAALFLIGGIGLSLFPSDMPGSKKKEHLVHMISVYCLYFTIIAFSIVSIVATHNAALIAYIVAQFTLVIYVWLMALYFFYKPSHNHFVFYETIGISTFFILFIALSLQI